MRLWGYNRGMAAQQNDIPTIQTPQAIHQQTVSNIADQLKAVYGTDENVMPVTAESQPEGETLQDLEQRLLWNKPGNEPSKSFLRKIWERVIKKNPGAQIKLVDKQK